MFFHLFLENESGDRIDMTTTANRYMTSKVEGISSPPCTISTSSYAGMDGSYLNNAFIEKRNVVIHFEMRGVGIEARRHQIYKVVKPSRYIKIYYKTAGIDVFTEGYVETCEVNNFEMFTTGQISILCPDIYWYATEMQTAEYSQVLGAFHFICPDKDYAVGDYVTVQHRRFGMIQPKIQLTGMIETFERKKPYTNISGGINMAFSCGFFNSKGLDRTYTAENFCDISAVSSATAFSTPTETASS